MKKLSQICFGCEPLGGTDWGDIDVNAIENAINVALDLGVNFFDTAGVYGLGLSEKRLSKFLGERRHNLTIATKGGLSWKKSNYGRSNIVKDSSPKAIIKDVENSLKRLKLETIPIFFVHWPDVNTPIEDTFIELTKQKNTGKIQSIGCSNFSAHQLERACNVSEVEYLQLPLNILNGSIDKSIAKICTNKNIKIVAYNVLLNGLLTGKFDIRSNFPEHDRRSRLPIFKGNNFVKVLESIEKLKLEAAEQNCSLVNYSIKWALMQKNVHSVVVGIKNSNQIIENFCKT